MRWRAVAAAGLMAAALAGCAGVSREPVNLDVRKTEIRNYVRAGDYARDIAAVAAEADRWIAQRAARGGAKLTVVLDLDETLLDNLSHMEENDFAWIRDRWTTWVAEARAPAIEPVRAVYRTARRLGVDVVYITGRPERDRPGTERNLKAIGCDDYAALICKPDAEKGTSAAYKTAARKRLVDAGRTIIANLGDQESDLSGGYAERTFKLPNPFYRTE